MNTFEMVVLIVLISVLAGVVNNYIKNRGSMSGQGGDEFETRLAQLDSLEERVRTLEKIVTDRNFELREKFRDL
ncbi:MAG: hypothetical protein MUP90_10135 [Gammaproteobacteria bacterium]|nr:hypothetical protein [Gammaproteobacteria bacterium]